MGIIKAFKLGFDYLKYDEAERQHSGGFFGIGCRIFCAAIRQRRTAYPTGNLAAGRLCPEKYPQVY